MPLLQSQYDDQSLDKGVLVKIGVYSTGVAESIGEKTKYLSDTGYTTADSVTSFLPYLTGSLKITESINAESSIAISFGDIEILNTDGSLDDWLDVDKYVWVNRPVSIYYCDPQNIVANEAAIDNTFDLIFNGIIADISSRSRGVLNFKIRDKMEKLNVPIHENVLGNYGTWPGADTSRLDTILPLVFGEPHNIPPKLVDPSLLEYMVNDGSISGITEIRDNGVPIYRYAYGAEVPLNGATIDSPTGKFKLIYPLVGMCTVSLQGINKSINLNTGALENTYSNNIAKIIALIVTQYGNVDSKLVASELDLPNLAAFAAANTQSIGLFISDRVNVLTVCQQIASSVGAQIYFTRQGKLQLLQYGVATTDAQVSITDDDIISGSLSIASRSEISAAKKLGYCKNWAVQENLVTNIPISHKDMFSSDWWLKTSADTTNVRTTYKLSMEPVQKDTLLIDGAQAQAEANRLNTLFGRIRTTYRFTAKARLLTLKLGQNVSLTHRRFNLSTGKVGQVVSLSPDWLKGIVDIEVAI